MAILPPGLHNPPDPWAPCGTPCTCDGRPAGDYHHRRCPSWREGTPSQEDRGSEREVAERQLAYLNGFQLGWDFAREGALAMVAFAEWVLEMTTPRDEE